MAHLWWSVNRLDGEITFELHVKTNGWIALGISPAGGMTGPDIGIGWIDRSGRLFFEDGHAYQKSEPIIDNTTVDWFGLQGREENGWTIIQFKRLLDTCDSMDVRIKSGTNILIFAYGLEDPETFDGKATITYHGFYSDRTDSSGIRFYLGNELRTYELGYLGLETTPNHHGIVIPPRLDQFVIDAYCTATATKRLPLTGVTVISAFPHTHLQGRSLWTKIIRNRTAVKYLFNAEAYDFNYQFRNTLPEPIKLYPGDELATRCVYSAKNKDVVTLGGESTREEMCLHAFVYYPRVHNLYTCFTYHIPQGWTSIMNISITNWDLNSTRKWLLEQNWTSEFTARWVESYNAAPRALVADQSDDLYMESLPQLPPYVDIQPEQCKRINSVFIHRYMHSNDEH